MAITEFARNERCPPSRRDIASAEMKCDTPCKRALTKVQEEMDDVKNSYIPGTGERREGQSRLSDIP